MAEKTQFTIGADVSCTDGVCGEVSRVVIDPVARAVTHLVVEPKHRQGLGRLVPLDLVDVTTGEVRLGCTVAEFDKLDHAEETQFVPGSLPLTGNVSQATITYDTIPLGEVSVRAATKFMRPTATSGESRGSSSTLAITT